MEGIARKEIYEGETRKEESEGRNMIRKFRKGKLGSGKKARLFGRVN